MNEPILGIDTGDRRCGLALSDDLRMLAHPLETVDVRQTDVFARIAEVVKTRRVALVVIGHPRNMDGSYGPMAEKAKLFAEKLRGQLPCPVKLWDERLTTVAASRALQEAGRNTRKQKGVIDQAAAQIILQSWLDAHPEL
ncbi:MAG TPA: Holliday junction resolvase RuvX [Chthoniobacterales bacterium]